MMERTLDRLREELDTWRGRLDHLRVQANLGKMEARDQLQSLSRELDPVVTRAEAAAKQLVDSGTDEARALARGVLAGWTELRKTYREASDEAARGRRG